MHIPSVPSRCKTTKTPPPPCAFEVHHTYTYKRYLRISIYVPQSFSSILTYSLPTYRESLGATNNLESNYIYLPPPNQIPPQSLESSTYLPGTYYKPPYLLLQALIPTSTIYITYIHRGPGVRRQVVYQTVTATLDFYKGYDSS